MRQILQPGAGLGLACDGLHLSYTRASQLGTPCLPLRAQARGIPASTWHLCWVPQRPWQGVAREMLVFSFPTGGVRTGTPALEWLSSRTRGFQKQQIPAPQPVPNAVISACAGPHGSPSTPSPSLAHAPLPQPQGPGPDGLIPGARPGPALPYWEHFPHDHSPLPH